MITSFIRKSNELSDLAIPGAGGSTSAPSIMAWQCDHLTLRIHDAQQEPGDKITTKENQHYAVEATLSDGLDKMQRYATWFMRRREKILGLLHKLQESGFWRKITFSSAYSVSASGRPVITMTGTSALARRNSRTKTAPLAPGRIWSVTMTPMFARMGLRSRASALSAIVAMRISKPAPAG